MPQERTAAELEQFWAGDFGDAWMDRNGATTLTRSWFWDEVAADVDPQSVLEIGCGTAGNLACLGSTGAERFGVDVNMRAIELARANVPGAAILAASVRALPFRDRSFDTVISMGLLIHQSSESVIEVMREMERVGSRHFAILEYHADEPTDVDYRGNPGVLVKRDFGGIFDGLFGFDHLRSEEINGPGFDRVQFELFRR